MFQKSKQILKNNLGVSIIYVLSVMTFLLVIAASALTAASSSGTSADQQTNLQLRTMSDSVSQNLMYALQHPYDSTFGSTTNSGNLGDQIVRNLYNNEVSSSNPLITRLNLNLGSGSKQITAVNNTVVSIVYNNTLINTTVTPTTVSASLTFNMSMTYKGKTAKIADTYTLSGATVTTAGTVSSSGTWRLETHDQSY